MEARIIGGGIQGSEYKCVSPPLSMPPNNQCGAGAQLDGTGEGDTAGVISQMKAIRVLFFSPT